MGNIIRGVNNFIKNRKFEVIAGIILLSFMLPILYACVYAVPSRDDFINTIGWMEYSNGSHFKYLFAAAWYDYRTFQGTYFGSFVNAFPVYYVLGYTGLRIWLLLDAILFFCSFFVFVYCILIWLSIEKDKARFASMAISALMLFYVLCLNDYCDDIFYWYTGACMYTLPLSLAFIAISCSLMYERNGKKTLLIIGSILAFMASGAILAVPAFLCGFLLLIIIYNFVGLRTAKKSVWIFGAAFLGALLNAFAPGNLVRATDDMSILITIGKMLRRVTHIYSQDIGNGSLLLVIFVSFIIGLKYLEKKPFEFSSPAVIAIICFIGPMVVDTPFMMASSDTLSVESLMNRYAFVEHICIAICAAFASLYIAGWAAQKHSIELRKEVVVVMVIVCLAHLSSLINVDNFIELTPYKMVQHMIINDNDFKKFSSRQEDILAQIENSDSSDVVVYSYRKKGGEWCNLSLIGLTDDENDLWYSVNRYLAKYYGKNTVTLKYID